METAHLSDSGLGFIVVDLLFRSGWLEVNPPELVAFFKEDIPMSLPQVVQGDPLCPCGPTYWRSSSQMGQFRGGSGEVE
jgi:hypothetical protein